MAIIWTPILAFSRAMLIPAQPALKTYTTKVWVFLISDIIRMAVIVS